MVYGFYFRFLKYTRSRRLSIILARLAYAVYVLIFELKRRFLKHEDIKMTEAEALELISSIYPDPGLRPEYNDRKIDKSLDLSIIVPVYNYVDLIEENIQSILNQKTDFSYELILVDDGSTDGSRDIVLKYQSRKNVKVILQQNKGIAEARNIGIDNAAGRYLMFIDCDDVIHENMIETLMSKACGEDADIVMCAHNLVKERQGEIYNVIPNVYPQVNLMGYRNHDEIMNYAGLPWGKVYRRELWNDIRFFPGYWYEDNIIHFLLFTRCEKFCYIPQILYEYRWYENNFSHVQGDRTAVKTIDCYWLLLAIIEKYRSLGLPLDEEFYTVLLKHVSAFYYGMIAGLDHDAVTALFVLACGLVKKYRPEQGCRLPHVLKVTEKAMLKGDINLWKLSCRYQ